MAVIPNTVSTVTIVENISDPSDIVLYYQMKMCYQVKMKLNSFETES